MNNHVDWDEVFEGPYSIYTRSSNGLGIKEFTYEEREASRNWNTCAVGGSDPALGEKWQGEYRSFTKIDHPSNLSQALEYFGMAFMYAIEKHDRGVAHQLWNGIKLLTPMVEEPKKKVAKKKVIKKVVKKKK